MIHRTDRAEAGDLGESFGMPLAFGIALAQDRRAVKAFSALPDRRKKQVIEGARKLQTSEEFHRYVSSIGHTSPNARSHRS